MTPKKKKDGEQAGSDHQMGCCSIESVVTIDERGQMVLPKELRDRAGIRAGDKLALIAWERDGQVCCFTMIKANEFGGMIRNMLDPIMGNPAE